ncbi:hypothetical protein MP228_007062 [Amoeboaphelidium protococcarum]|nr:hypothetical protein MP228_007062 [Amoeboaphelidium protococcarum]
MYYRSQIQVQVVSVWILFFILVSDAYPVRDILPSDGAKSVEIFKREAGAAKGGSKSGASSSNGKSGTSSASGSGPSPSSSSSSSRSASPSKSASPGPAKSSSSDSSKASSIGSGGPVAPAKGNSEASKAVTASAAKSDAGKDSDKSKAPQHGPSGPPARQSGPSPNQQSIQAGGAKQTGDQGKSQSADANRGVTGQTDTANTPQRGAVSGAPQGGPVDGAPRAAQQQQRASDLSVSQQSPTLQGVGQQPVGQGGAPQAPPVGNPTPPSGPSQPQGVNGPSDAQGAPASLPSNGQPAAAAPQAPSVAAPQPGSQPAAPAVSAPQPGTQPAAAVEGAPPAVAQQSVPAGQDVATAGQAPAADSGTPPAVSSDSATQGAAEVNDVTKMNHFSNILPKSDVMTLQNVEAVASENGKDMPNTAEQQKLAAQAPPDTVKVEYGRFKLSQDTLKTLGYTQDQMNQMNSGTEEGYKLSKDAAAYALKTFGTDSFVAQQMGPQAFTNFKQGTMSPQEQQKFADLKAQYTNDIAPRPPSVERIVAPPSIVSQRNAETQAPQPAVGSQNFFQNANPAVKSMADNAFQMNQAGPQQAPGSAPPGQPAAGEQPSAMPAQIGPQRLNSDMLNDLGYSQQEMNKMNEQTPAGQALSNSATAHAISEFGVNGFVAAQLGPEFTKRMTNNQMTSQDRQAFNDMKAQLTKGVDMSQYQGRP